MSRKRCFVNKKSGKKFEEIFDAFVVAKTAKGASDVTIRNYHQITCSFSSSKRGVYGESGIALTIYKCPNKEWSRFKCFTVKFFAPAAYDPDHQSIGIGGPKRIERNWTGSGLCGE